MTTAAATRIGQAPSSFSAKLVLPVTILFPSGFRLRGPFRTGRLRFGENALRLL